MSNHQAEIERLTAFAKSIVFRVESENRALSAGERKDVEDAVDRAGTLKRVQDAEDMINQGTAATIDGWQNCGMSPSRGFTAGKSLIKATQSAVPQVEPGRIKHAQLSRDADGTKALIAAGDEDTLLNTREAGIDRMASVDRFVYTAFPSRNIDETTALVEYIAQSDKDLASDGAVRMNFASSAEKPVINDLG